MNDKQLAISLVFIMEGINQCDGGKVRDTAGMGHIDFVDALLPYAVLVEEAWRQVLEHEFPGVFEYEVTEPFGAWIGQYILTHNCFPLTQEAKRWVVDTAWNFVKEAA